MGYACAGFWNHKYWELQKQFPIVLDDVMCTDTEDVYLSCEEEQQQRGEEGGCFAPNGHALNVTLLG